MMITLRAIIVVLLQIGWIPSVYTNAAYEVNFLTNSRSVSESDGMINIALNITGGSGFTLVQLSATDGTAIMGMDYNLLTTTTGDGNVLVEIIDDNINEEAESFNISITSCVDQITNDVCTVGSIDTIEITIEATFEVNFLTNSLSVSEGDGTINITVNITGGSGYTTVELSASNGTAIMGMDYNLLTTTIADGDVEVQIVDDDINEEAESFNISITSCTDQAGIDVCTVGSIDTIEITIESNDGAGAGQDPHFVVPILSGNKFCYSMQGMADFIFNLVSDAFININAYFVKPEDGNRFKEYATFLGDIGILVQFKGHKETMTKIRISASDRSVTVGGSKTIVKDHSVDLLIDDSSVVVRMGESTSNKKTSSVTVTVVEPSLAFEVSFVNNHVDLIFADDSGVSKNCHGIIGQFLHKEAKVINNEHININGRYIPVERLPVWDFVNANDSCLHAKAKGGFQAEGIIEGKYTDYIVESLFSPHFYYSKFKEL